MGMFRVVVKTECEYVCNHLEFHLSLSKCSMFLKSDKLQFPCYRAKKENVDSKFPWQLLSLPQVKYLFSKLYLFTQTGIHEV